MIVVICYYQFCFQRATRENTFHCNWCHPLKIKVKGYHRTTTPTRQKLKLSFSTDTSITVDPSLFHNLYGNFKLGFKVVLSETIQKRIICLICNLIQGKYYIYHD